MAKIRHLLIGSNLELGLRAILECIGAPVEGPSLPSPEELRRRVDQIVGVSVVVAEERFWIHDPDLGRWVHLPDREVRKAMQRYDGCPYGPPDKGGKQRTLSVSSTMLGSAMSLLRDRLTRPDFFEGSGGFTFRGAYFNPDNGDFEGPHPEHRCFIGVNEGIGEATAALVLDDLDPLDPRWLERLPPLKTMAERFHATEDASASARAYQEVIGLGLIGAAPDYEKALILAGSKGAGKSVLGRIPASLFPPGLVHIGEARRRGGPSYELAHLRGKRLIVFDDCSDLGDVKHFNRLVTAEGIDLRALGSHTEQWFPRLGVVVTCNRLPRLAGDVGGLSRRLIVLWFAGKPERTERKSHLLREIEAHRIGMLAWFLAGARRAIKAGAVTITPETERYVAEWERTADPVRAWAVDRLEIEAEGRLYRAAAFGDFRAWAEAQEGPIPADGQTGFTLELKAVLADLGVRDTGKNNGDRYWPGVQLIQTRER